jgi:hypothetical protein
LGKLLEGKENARTVNIKLITAETDASEGFHEIIELFRNFLKNWYSVWHLIYVL